MSQTLPRLPVIRTLGGCGGTLISRLFSALPRVIVLSETNPRSANLFGFHLNPLRQLRQWNPQLMDQVLEFDDAELGEPGRFGAMLTGVMATAASANYRLIVRDFNYADYIGVPFIWPVPGNSSLDIALAGRFRARSIYVVRHPADQLASLRSHSALAQVLTASRFIAGSLAFLQDRTDAPCFRYEDLLASPERQFSAMCEGIGIPFEPSALSRFADITQVTGSLTRAAETLIEPGKPQAGAAQARAELEAEPGYERLLSALGYAA